MRKFYMVMVLLLGCAMMVGCHGGEVHYIGTVTEYETAIVKLDDGVLKEVQVVAFIDEATGERITAYDDRNTSKQGVKPITIDQRYMFTVMNDRQRGEMYPITSVLRTDAPVCNGYGNAERLVDQAANDDNMIDLSELVSGKGKVINKAGSTFYVILDEESMKELVERIALTQDKLAAEQETGDDEERDEDQDGD